jgi:acyl transferase domain-containing protein/thioesterase domain-containing protein
MNFSELYPQFNGSEIAIIGMAGRFPSAQNLDEFWDNLQNGVESISFFTNEELASSVEDVSVLHNPNFVKAKAIIEDAELFDAEFFGFNPREAEITDPQHRLLLECAWEALEGAGYDSETYKRSIGVYAGTSLNSYFFNLYSKPNFINSVDSLQLVIGSDKDFLTTRISYKLNLEGPSYTVQTACSTSLVAVHLACQGLLNGDCDMALAGGVSIGSPRKSGYLYQEGGILSPDGHCRAFDAKAQGTPSGEGVGLVVLKRLEDALADGDFIQAVIKGSAINNDGSFKVSYTAPRIDSQAKAIRTAQVVAEVEPETITYIEAHGTGTALGDPIEIAALTQAFRASTNKKGFCAIGSVKTNIGHLDAAAGVAGLIKTVLALKHKQIPPSLHFEKPNPKIDFDNSPFYVNRSLSEWKTNGTPRRAGISSFGIGGTNAHMILEEAPPQEDSGKSRPWQLLVLSAKTHSALETATAKLAEQLKQQPDLNLADVAYTLQVGRRAFPHRRTVVCRGVEDAIAALEDPKRALANIQETSTRPVAFMFTGLGSHYLNMGWELYQVEPTFQEAVDDCCEFLKPLLGLDLKDVIYPNKNQNDALVQKRSGLDLRQMLGRDQETTDEATEKLNQTYLTQPAIFVIEYALAQLWMSWGIRPAALIGYSIGEYVAATLAGVLSLEDALTLVAKRAQMIQELPGGAMLAVPLAEKEVPPLLNKNLSLSAINGPSLCTIAGTIDAVDELERQLTERGLACRRLVTSHAFHSYVMEPIAASFTKLVQTVDLQPPKTPYISNVTGTWITASEATDPSYWTKHLCQPVRFADGVNELWRKHRPILLEVGPGQTLGSLALQCIENQQMADRVVLPSLRYAYDRQSDVFFLLNTLGQLWLSGVQIDWSGVYAHEHRHRVPLPTYPFERQRYWIEPQKPEQVVPTEKAALEKKPDLADWFYISTWKQSMPPVSMADGSLAKQKLCWLVFIDKCGIGSQIVERLKRENQDVIVVRTGEELCQSSDWEYIINPRQENDYTALLQDLHTRDKLPNLIVQAWSVQPEEQAQSGIELFKETQTLGFYSLLFLAQALGKQLVTDPLQIWVLSNKMQAVESTDVLSPEKATILGLCNVIPQEYTNITCHSVDFVLPESGSRQEEKLIDQLMVELMAPSSDLMIAYRGNHRWIQDHEPIRLEDRDGCPTRLREGGVYLITGGLGKLGLMLAEYLADRVQSKLVLLGRSGLPARQEWEQWLANHDEQDKVSTRIRKVQRLEEIGAEVLVISADVANEAQMQAAIRQSEERFGRIHGVIHAAGIVEQDSLTAISETGYAECELHFQPKVYGLYTLEKVLQDREFDYCFLISSVSSILGGLGFTAYSSANIFLDAFAHRQTQLNYGHWCSTNWYLIDNPEETMEAFHRILCSNLVPQIAISQIDLRTQFDRWIKRKTWQRPEDAKNTDTTPSLHPRPRSNLRNPYVAPRSETERRIAKHYQELLGIEQVGVYDNFFDLGGNSLIGMQLISRLRQDFQTEFLIHRLLEAPTVAELAVACTEKLTENSNKKLNQQFHSSLSPLVGIQPHGSNRPLFFVHPVGGNVLCYHELARYMGLDQPFYGLQSPGVNGNCEPHTRIEDMATDYIEALRFVQSEGPYFLGGWSMGGIVAFEIAQQLQKQNREVALLALLDSPAPVFSNKPIDIYDCDDTKVLADLAIDMARFAGKNLRDFAINLKGLEPAEQLNYFLEQMKINNLLPPDIEHQQLRCLAEVFKNNAKAMLKYVPQVYSSQIVIFKAHDSISSELSNQTLGWEELSSEPLEVVNVPGDHYTMLRLPHIQVLAEKLRVHLQINH